ncbi:hypothetical protein PTI45_03159 [Paenibacillus nuruki]|uniref:Uncharacterized protein n=1 Tax=Paenibacillus nuruki TaxID=1886670 RepID=A0A1E3L0X3_9BACL|nr:hypothetical protein [Paenibacillus nuruki]ODP27449.1 hypothetical protein PTI45_03159 [Paenibacillus nuruki]
MSEVPATIEIEQLKDISSRIKVGESETIISEDGQVCIIMKVTFEELEAVRGNKPLTVSAYYIDALKTLAFSVGTVQNPDIVTGGMPNTPELKRGIRSSLARGIEAYIVTENVQEYSIKRFLNNEIGRDSLQRELNKM